MGKMLLLKRRPGRKRCSRAGDIGLKGEGDAMKKKILIVDDESTIRKTYSKILVKNGFEVLEAGDAVTGREILLREDIDLVLLDMNMPEVKGEEFFQVIKMFHRDIKIIISSVYPTLDQRKAAHGADDYFDKSEGLRTLIRKIKSQFDISEEKKVIVCIDDDPHMRMIYNNMLEMSGFETICFSDSKTALQFLMKKNNRFNLIIMDLAMPNLDGRTVLDLVKRKDMETKILVASNYDVEHQRELVPEAEGYFDKCDGGIALIEKIKSMV